MGEPAELPPPRPRRRWRRLLMLLVVPLAVLLTGAWGYLYVGSALRLRRAIAEADRLDPHWRLEDLETDRAAVPDEENGALTIRAATAKLPAGWKPDDLHDKRGVGGAGPNIALADRLKRVAAAIQEARRLADQPRGRLSHGAKWDALNIETLLYYDVQLRTQEGDLDGALASCRAIINSGRSVGDDPSEGSQFLRVSTGHEAARRVEHVLGTGEPSDAALAALQKLLTEEAEAPLFTTALRGERARTNRLLEQVQRGDMTANQLLVTIGGPLTPRAWKSRDIQFYLPGAAAESRAAVLERMTRLVEISRLPPHEQAGPLAAWQASRKDEPLLARLILPAMPSLELKMGRANQALLRCAVVALAAERYRRANRCWPETLADLKGELLAEVPLDPYDGQPLRYCRDDKGVVIYSVGEDLKDDGGNRAKLWGEGKGTDLGLQLWDADKRGRSPK